MYNQDLYEYAQQKQIIVERLKIPKNKSLSVRIQNKDFIAIDECAMENSAEERTHLAHELGHCETGAFYEMYSPFEVRGKAEYKANKWAVLKCIPKDELVDLLRKGYQRWELAEHFGVTEKFVETACTYYFEYGIAV